ncbi:MAG: hydrolase [Bacillota bacterium]|nr:hydrolase [Bacillota bacterium]
MEKSANSMEFIEANRTALVAIDLQNGISNRHGAPYTGEQVIQNAAKLVKGFTQKGAFVVLVRVSTLDGKDMLKPNTDVKHTVQFQEGWDNLVPELAKFKNAHIITKRQWGAFYGTDLDLQLRRRKIDTVVLCGISTSIGVDTTAREAYQHGYNQIFAEDAMTSASEEEHAFVCRHIFPRIGRVRATDEIISALK